jgi:hypothetical protein
LKNNLVDSGERTNYGDGSAMREPDDNKPQPSLISPFALRRIAMHLTNGAKKYEPDNWIKGMPYRRYTDSMFRHLLSWCAGETEEDHLAALCFNAMAIIHHQECGETEQWDNMPKYKKVKNE